MTVEINDLVKALETWFPPELAEEWDNIGWMVEPRQDEIDRVLVSVDPSPEAVEAAVTADADVLVSHHPLIFDPLSAFRRQDPTARLVARALRNELGIYSAHTNADSAPGGLNDRLAQLLDLTDVEPLEPGEKPGVGLGRIGRLGEERTVGWAETTLEEALPLRHSWSTVEPDVPVRKLGICSGSGGDFVGPDLAGMVDLYISGDVGHHTALEARQLGLPLLVLDHHDMETVFCDLVLERLRERFGSRLEASVHRRTYPYRHRWMNTEDPISDEEEPR